MKFYSLLVILCFLQTLICDKAGVNQETLKEAVNLSLPFIKSFHPAPFSLTGSSIISPKLSYTEIGPNNIQFVFDEFGLLHLKFVNLKGSLKGSLFVKKNGGGFFPYTYASFTCELSNINWEETYAVESTEKAEGKYDVKFKSISDSSVSFNIFRLVMANSSQESQTNAKIQINRLNFAPFKAHLKKMSGLILETLQNKLK